MFRFRIDSNQADLPHVLHFHLQLTVVIRWHQSPNH